MNKFLLSIMLLISIDCLALDLEQPLEIRKIIAQVAKEYIDSGIDAHLLDAISFTESTWRTNAVSSIGAYGLFQITKIAEDEVFRVTKIRYNRFNTFDNVRIAIEYILILQNHYKIDTLENVLRYYNGGWKYNEIASTKVYTDKIFKVKKFLSKRSAYIEEVVENNSKLLFSYYDSNIKINSKQILHKGFIDINSLYFNIFYILYMIAQYSIAVKRIFINKYGKIVLVNIMDDIMYL